MKHPFWNPLLEDPNRSGTKDHGGTDGSETMAPDTGEMLAARARVWGLPGARALQAGSDA